MHRPLDNVYATALMTLNISAYEAWRSELRSFFWYVCDIRAHDFDMSERCQAAIEH